MRKSISQGHLQQCLILEKEAVRWITDLQLKTNIQKKRKTDQKPFALHIKEEKPKE